MKKRVLTLAIAGLMVVTALTGCGSLKGDETAATVDGTDITAGLVNFFARYTQAQYETYYSAYLGEDMWNSEASEGETYEESVKNSVLETLENMILLEKHMDEYDVTITDEEKEQIEKTAKQFDDGNALEEKELISGDKDTVERALTLMMIQQKMINAIQADADTEVSDEEAAQKRMDYVFFSYTETDEEGNQTDVSDEQKEELKNKAQSISDGLKAGGDFTELAQAAETEVKNTTFDSESTTPDEELIKAADALEEGGVTDVIEDENGCYVAKVTSLLDREATDSKKSSIVQERKSELYQETCDKWKEEVDITVHKEVLKKISFQKVSVTMKTQEEVPYTDQVQTDDQADDDAQ